ncbi:MAG: aminoglycoside 6-adenylyltransferase [Proteobacteria bacterium]|nr:aminoglycoside 6-adenylyltransferase [Pseudomonadota bacterium]
MKTSEDVVKHFKDWAQSNDLVRAAVLTSSRVKPDANVDDLSDYDIEMVVADLQPFQRDDGWLEDFGPIMVRWPNKPRSTGRDSFVTRLVLFKDFVRIDFQITDQSEIEPGTYDDGYRILIDKDNLTSCLNQPTYQDHIVKKPAREEFETLVNEFWWAATYVPKYLWRDELPFAKYMLDNVIRYDYLHKVLEWTIGLQRDWSVNTGIHGKSFKKFLDVETWAELESTYTGAKTEDNWEAFFKTIDLFRRLATFLAHRLNFSYPVELDKEVTDYCRHIQVMKPQTAR